MKDFVKEFQKFVRMLKAGEEFALGRFADGEGCIILNMDESQGGWVNRERLSARWQHIPGDPIHEAFRSRLTAALAYAAPGYHVGLPCRSDHSSRYAHFFGRLKSMTNVSEEQLTFARVFHSYNYRAFIEDFLPTAFLRKVFLICNERADSSSLSGIVKRWDVAAENASLKSLSVIDEVKRYIVENRIRGGVFLLSAGPSSGIFAHELWHANRDNSYVDIGSAMDPIYFRSSPCRGITRNYLEAHACGDTPASPFVWG